jgi:hypothetical protein
LEDVKDNLTTDVEYKEQGNVRLYVGGSNIFSTFRQNAVGDYMALKSEFSRVCQPGDENIAKGGHGCEDAALIS